MANKSSDTFGRVVESLTKVLSLSNDVRDKLTPTTKFYAGGKIRTKLNEEKTEVEFISLGPAYFATLIISIEEEFTLFDIPSEEFAYFTTIQLIVDYVDKVQDSEVVCN